MAIKHVPGHFDFLELPSPSVESLGRTKTFLSKVFGWSFEDYGPDYADIRGAGLSAGINADPEHRQAQPLPVIYTDQLEAMRAQVVEAGGVVERDIFSFPGGRRFHFREPSGTLLAVWSDK
ncbi:MAG: VOC family protein [Myxococcota bacterium]